MKEIDIIYNRFGDPELRLLGDGRLVSFNGQNYGFINGTNVYAYDGIHVGFFERGILRDHYGHTVGFGENPTDTFKPLLPLKRLKPLPGLIQLPPLRPLTQLPPLPSLKSFYWSSFLPHELFLKENSP
jgi:hypothetical protein